ncbi:MAG: haloacid dehalogenase-like hydrolase [Chitinophaga sp.]|uniref:HAD family hydrolase n=1 Tax=Chitinophaga sp. TaxID=1869181 RepID=UPI0025B97792|nr:HAD family hydrolase [Chitinophaga sp.]MBV8253508.1 haloacid dehalogenase-like hydrolase [Chitinophaga sp.]
MNSVTPKMLVNIYLLIFISFRTLAQDPLPSWNDGPVKKSIIDFVVAVSTPGNIDFVPEADRIATFDNDGTLWTEKPLIQGLFAVYRVHRMVQHNPSLRDKQPYKAVMESDRDYFEKAGMQGVMKLFDVTHAGMTSTEFEQEVKEFFRTVQHPTLHTSLYNVTYKPQIELLKYLRAHGFKTFICSGGTEDFMRVVTDSLYGIPPEQVIGSEMKMRYIDSAGINDMMRLPGMKTLNDKQEKPINIRYHIGKRPILACGNEGGAGDIYMLRYCQGNTYRNLQLLINHDDADREFKYEEKDNTSLNMAKQFKWQVVSIKQDWKYIFPQ